MKNANDAPAMAQAALRSTHLNIGQGFADALAKIAALPPAPLPADAAAIIAEAVDWEGRRRTLSLGLYMGPDQADEVRAFAQWGMDAARRLAALAQPAAPMTEADVIKEATDGRR